MAGRCDQDFRLDDLLRDPIVALVMRRDGVDADELRRLIRSKASRSAPARRPLRGAASGRPMEQRPAA